MPGKRLIYLILLQAAVFPLNVFPQEPGRLRFSREKHGFVFFQLGEAADTIREGSGDLFRFEVSDSLKAQIYFSVENGRLESTGSDSVLKLRHFPGICYLSQPENTPGDSARGLWLRPLINGAASLPREQVRVTVLHRLRGRLLSSEFVFRERERGK